MTERDPEHEPNGEDARLKALQKRLNAAHHAEKVRKGEHKDGHDENYRLGNRVLAELIGGMVGGAVVGWVIDRFAGTAPWALLVMLFLGTAVAFRNIIRISSRRSE